MPTTLVDNDDGTVSALKNAGTAGTPLLPVSVVDTGIGPGDDDAANVKVLENGRFQSITLVTGANILGAAGKAGDYIEEIHLYGGVLVSAAPASAGTLSIRNQAAITIREFDLQTVNTDLGPVVIIPVHLVTTDRWDIFLQSNVLASVSRAYATGRFSDV